MEDLIIEITADQPAVSIIKELERIGYIQAYNILFMNMLLHEVMAYITMILM